MPRHVVMRSRIDLPDALLDQLKIEAAWVRLSPATYASLLLSGYMGRPTGPVDLTEQAIRRWEQLAKMAGDIAAHARSRGLITAGARTVPQALPEGCEGERAALS